ncbi:hypothetical protein ACH4KN_27070 [Streptomyces sp. NPDC017546]|uniref:hypothetical protein n=1 Tax=Streptomyces sp. NPDC017546 TaxID=3365001 RepID=UPI0037A86CF6
MDLRFGTGRPGYPYLDETSVPAVMAERDQQNLYRARSVGAAGTGVTLARHHLLPCKDILHYWNFAVDHFYGSNTDQLPKSVEKFFDSLIKYVNAAPLAAIADKGALVNFLRALKDKKISHEGGAAGEYVEQKEEFRQVFAWCPGNLIIGPEPYRVADNRAGRVDDPQDDPEIYLADEAKPPAVSQLLTCRELLVPGQNINGTERTLKPQYVPRLEIFFQNYRRLFEYGSAAVSYPQKVADTAWTKIPPDWAYVRRAIGKNGTPSKNDYVRNTTGNTLRQAASRSRNCPVSAKIPRDRTSFQTLPATSPTPSSVTIGNTVVPLTVDATWNDGGCDYRRYLGSAHGVEMAGLLSWASETWKIPVELPDWVRNLKLREVAFESVVSDQWTSWKVSLGVAMDVSGMTADAVVTLECATGRAVALAAYLALRNQDDPEADPLLLSGALIHTATDGWDLTASLAAPEPIRLADLARCFSIPPEDLPEELSEMAPAVSNADLLYTRSAAGQVLALTVKTEHVEIALACSSPTGSREGNDLATP